MTITPETDSVLDAMRRAGAPLTRENYLYWAFAGNPPDEIDELETELESTIPIQFRREALDEPEGGVQ